MPGEGTEIPGMPTWVDSIDKLPEEFRLPATDAIGRVEALRESKEFRELAGTASGPGTNGDSEHAAIPFLPESDAWEVGGTTYELRAPVIKQEKQILELLRESQKGVALKIDGGDLKKSAKRAAEAAFSLDNLVNVLGDGIAKFFAIILTPAGQAVKDKDLGVIAAHLEDNLSITQQAEALKGFFGYAQYAGKLLAPQIESMAVSITGAIKKGLSR
jgi:hypothetical protein